MDSKKEIVFKYKSRSEKVHLLSTSVYPELNEIIEHDEDGIFMNESKLQDFLDELEQAEMMFGRNEK